MYPSREFWKMGSDKAHSIIAKLTNARNLLLKNNEQQVDKPEMTEEQILKDARTWVDMYNQKKNTKFERIRNIQLQTKVKELLENNKKEKDKEKREALEEKKEREKSWVDDKK